MYHLNPSDKCYHFHKFIFVLVTKGIVFLRSLFQNRNMQFRRPRKCRFRSSLEFERSKIFLFDQRQMTVALRLDSPVGTPSSQPIISLRSVRLLITPVEDHWVSPLGIPIISAPIKPFLSALTETAKPL